MIKLRISESEDMSNLVYMEFIPFYSFKNSINEEIINPDDVIQNARKYSDPIETRDSLFDYLDPIAKRIKNENEFVVSCDPDTSPQHIKWSLSNYLEILFKHPSDLSQEEIDKWYRYAIRFSDHNNVHPKTYKTSEIDIRGMKPKNFEKAAIRAFKTSISDINNRIAKFEKQKYGKQITFLNN